MNAIELNNVSVKFSNKYAVHNCDISFKTGEFTVLLGASGAGKSTLLRTLNLLQKLTTGEIFVPGLGKVEGVTKTRRHRKSTAMVFQSHQLLERKTALENTVLGRLPYHHGLSTLLPFPNRDRLLALENLERVGLLEKALTKSSDLSGGQKQRVGIARALTQGPKIILADEPIASLDPVTSDGILKLLKDISIDLQITTILSLHQIDFACKYADRLIGLNSGSIIFDGKPNDLTESDLKRIYETESKQIPTTTQLLATLAN
ncbi:phosphonate ABC transporter ATP-binding protein [Cyanobium sp. Tous-M-B4]|jgi:phosphonate transport system ATP-binding protein|uniref:phosphonate ABC transporter ATP-binding protein n=1 Tax=Cyanobium sp. Tous-M-B4 TaxID=2823724 RepID=UPI0020CF3D77|nr:phosphonate ABC transporter ATP-binding protein [Cyanobium sp. Tous-M-B4]MCP9778373.1 phosphonate ABC transporter ATP-binding protein [Cyanobium sp. Tous-M-B4]